MYTHATALEFLGTRAQRRVAPNTSLRNTGDWIELVLHGNTIACLYVDGSAQLFTRRWRTVTTKGRLNQYIASAQISQRKYVWYQGDHEFHEGMVIVPGHSDDLVAFHRAIALAPGDNLPKCIFADWLDEHGYYYVAKLLRGGQ